MEKVEIILTTPIYKIEIDFNKKELILNGIMCVDISKIEGKNIIIENVQNFEHYPN